MHNVAHICIPTNGVVTRQNQLIMGAGVAAQAARRFPDLPGKLGRWVMNYGNRAFLCREEHLITWPTKHRWKDGADIELVVRSAAQVVQIADKFGLESIALPRVGCGLGSLLWEDIYSRLSVLLDDRFVVVC